MALGGLFGTVIAVKYKFLSDKAFEYGYENYEAQILRKVSETRCFKGGDCKSEVCLLSENNEVDPLISLPIF